MTKDLYSDIAQRTGGDIYIGVVGPVRTGKSTFIKQFMEKLVIPNIDQESKRDRAVDELPQSAGGRTIMTTEPKFIPEEAVTVTLGENARFRVRMIDCVGYIVPSALGYFEEEAPRMVQTPWFEEAVPFNMAAEVGTERVISEHSTIGLVITTDGSITDLPREEYAACEARVIAELQELEKPFVVLLNCVNPHSKQAKELAASMQEQYGASVLPVCCPDLEEADIQAILTQLLYAFPVREINVRMANWITGLEKGHWLKEAVFSCIRQTAASIQVVRDTPQMAQAICDCPYIQAASIAEMDLGTGSITIAVTLDQGLFYKILGEATGLEIEGENDLLPILTELSRIQKACQDSAGTGRSGGNRLWHCHAGSGRNGAGRTGNHQTGRQVRRSATCFCSLYPHDESLYPHYRQPHCRNGKAKRRAGHVLIRRLPGGSHQDLGFQHLRKIPA